MNQTRTERIVWLREKLAGHDSAVIRANVRHSSVLGQLEDQRIRWQKELERHEATDRDIADRIMNPGRRKKAQRARPEHSSAAQAKKFARDAAYEACERGLAQASDEGRAMFDIELQKRLDYLDDEGVFDDGVLRPLLSRTAPYDLMQAALGLNP